MSKPKNKTPQIEAPIFLSQAILVASACVNSAKKYGAKENTRPYKREKIDINNRLILIIIKPILIYLNIYIFIRNV